MKLIRFRYQDSAPQVGILQDDAVYRLAGDLSAPAAGEQVAPLTDVQLLAPVVPGKIIAIGLNYADHVTEMDPTRAIPENPTMFMKPPSAVIGPGEPIRIANPANDTHYEAELCVVIGTTASRVPEAQALDYVLGYTCGNDVSDRKVQYAIGQWIQGKGYDSYCPLGPWIETDLDPANAEVMSRLNGEPRQQGNTAQLMFSVPYLIHYVSEVMTLNPGDVIMTGTPHGVGPMHDGDIIEIEVSGIGTLRNPVTLRDAEIATAM